MKWVAAILAADTIIEDFFLFICLTLFSLNLNIIAVENMQQITWED